MHLTITRVHGILPIKHLEEWLAYGKCSVNISTLHLNYSRCPFTTPTGPPSPTQPGLSFTMFSFHHSQFGLTSLPPSLGPIQLHLLPLGVCSSLALPPHLPALPLMISLGQDHHNDLSSVFSTLIHSTQLYLFMKS